MFDRSYLPSADLEFVVMTDTHYMLDPGTRQVEFESRRLQASRAEHAYELVRSLDTSFIVHLGDLVQEFPESAGFEESLQQALEQIREAGIHLHQVAGNHDVGDKPDPTMPTDWATPGSLKAFHRRFGSSWKSWDQGGCHFIVLNSQIMNGPLPEAKEQERWLEEDLAEHSGMPVFIFLHLAPFLVDEHEQGLGHYDNIDEPGRSWLLDLIRRHDVQMVFAGHSHFAFFNRIGHTRSYVVPSTAFTRPGFCEVFSSPPPPERGRDDAEKLGFFLVRVRDGRPVVHLVRTGGAAGKQNHLDSKRRLLTRVSRDLPASPLGVTLRHPLTSATEVPIAWQSTVRQPVRNDFPLLACVELGVRHVRVPASDLSNPQQRDRLAVLRDEGVTITVFWTWSDRCQVVQEASEHRDLVDGVEILIPGALLPDEGCLQAMAQSAEMMPVTLAPLLPREIVPGKQHARTRIGFHLDELEPLNRFLEDRGHRVDRILCRVDAAEHPLDLIGAQSALGPLASIGAIDWAVEFQDAAASLQVPRAVGAVVAVAAHEESRIFLEPLVDLDRTMDAPPGLLDRLCNPRPVFHAVKTLNTVLFSEGGQWSVERSSCNGRGVTIALERQGSQVLVALPTQEDGGAFLSDVLATEMPEASWAACLVGLEDGTTWPLAGYSRSQSPDLGTAVLITSGRRLPLDVSK